MSAHTPEPWKLGSWGDNIFSVQGDTWTEICRVKRDDKPVSDSQDGADARRIVACVNACACIRTEALEAGAVKDLVEALEHVLPYAKHFWRPGEQPARCIAAAGAALSKVLP